MKTLVLVGAASTSPACSFELSDDYFRAVHHAPVIYQDTDDSFAEADFITDFGYDGNSTADDNWDNFENHLSNLTAHVYFSVVETSHYWFIVYSFFHPRDWSDSGVGQHENDLEGVLEIIEKDDSEFGRLIGMITVFHDDFYSYTPEGSPLGMGEESIDGTVEFSTLDDGLRHPRVSIQAKGHGVKAWPHAGDFDGEEGDGIIYVPDLEEPFEGELPPSGDPDDPVEYSLMGIDLLWAQQIAQAFTDKDAASVYAEWGTMKGDDGSDDAAHLPWRWDDKGGFLGIGADDHPAGMLGLDPATIADGYFSGIAAEARYESNDFLFDLRANHFDDKPLPAGWPEDLSMDELIAKAPSLG